MYVYISIDRINTFLKMYHNLHAIFKIGTIAFKFKFMVNILHERYLICKRPSEFKEIMKNTEISFIF